VITLQIAHPSSRQRGRPTETRPQISDSNTPTGSNIWSQVPQGCSIPIHTDRLTVSRKVTSTSTSYGCESRGIRNQELLCWRGTAVIYQTGLKGLEKVYYISCKNILEDTARPVELARILVRGRYFLLHSTQIGSAVLPASYPMGTGS
jgi:hypothetical protein